MVDHLIFDLDGTLVDSATICTDILNAMLRDRGIERTIRVDEAVPYMSRGGTHLVSGLLAEHCHDPVSDLAEFRQRYAISPTPHGCMFPGVRDGLRRLKSSGYSLAICSNKPQNLCEKVLDDVGLRDHFPVVVGSRPGLRPKPHPDLLDATLDALGTDAQRCLFVGDSDLDRDIAGARGVPFLFVTYGYGDEAMEQERLTRFSAFSDLVEFVTITYGRSQRFRNVA